MKPALSVCLATLQLVVRKVLCLLKSIDYGGFILFSMILVGAVVLSGRVLV